MDVVTKSVRYLVRETMKECNIEHRSGPDKIWTRCFASTPTHSIEYDGPVYILMHSFPKMEAVAFGEGPMIHEDYVTDRVGLDINNPNFQNILKNFLNKHISHKRKYFDCSKIYALKEGERYVRNEIFKFPEKPTVVCEPSLWERIKVAWAHVMGHPTFLSPPDDIALEEQKRLHACWAHAVMRHLHDVDADDVKNITETAKILAAKNLTPLAMENATTYIRSQLS